MKCTGEFLYCERVASYETETMETWADLLLKPDGFSLDNHRSRWGLFIQTNKSPVGDAQQSENSAVAAERTFPSR